MTAHRKQELLDEKDRQLASDQMRKRFIKLATELSAWLEQTQGRLNNVGIGDTSLEDQVKLLSTLDEDLETQRSKLIELEDCHQVGLLLLILSQFPSTNLTLIYLVCSNSKMPMKIWRSQSPWRRFVLCGINLLRD